MILYQDILNQNINNAKFYTISESEKCSERENMYSSNETRICILCYQEKDINQFEITTQTRTKTYRKSGCRSCIKTRRIVEKDLQKIYGRTRPTGTPCDNCGKTSSRLSLDHCHDTGEFRGWLCQPCNTSIGVLGDDIDSLKKAVAYLERAKSGLHKTKPIGLVNHD